jgi:hypothetical protein
MLTLPTEMHWTSHSPPDIENTYKQSGTIITAQDTKPNIKHRTETWNNNRHPGHHKNTQEMKTYKYNAKNTTYIKSAKTICK